MIVKETVRTVPVGFFSFVVVCCLFIMCNSLYKRTATNTVLCSSIWPEVFEFIIIISGVSRLCEL